MTEIHLERFNYGPPEVTLYISEEGARYIAQVMEDEAIRTSDGGAREIAHNIEEALR
jgi:hypothetical protein